VFPRMYHRASQYPATDRADGCGFAGESTRLRCFVPSTLAHGHSPPMLLLLPGFISNRRLVVRALFVPSLRTEPPQPSRRFPPRLPCHAGADRASRALRGCDEGQSAGTTRGSWLVAGAVALWRRSCEDGNRGEDVTEAAASRDAKMVPQDGESG
jgi:hypothetical protein